MPFLFTLPSNDRGKWSKNRNQIKRETKLNAKCVTQALTKKTQKPKSRKKERQTDRQRTKNGKIKTSNRTKTNPKRT